MCFFVAKSIVCEVLVEDSRGGFEEVVGSNDADELIVINDRKTANTITSHELDRRQ